MKAMLCCAALLLAAPPALAAAGAPAAAPAAADAEPAPSPKICKVNKATGSLTRKQKICLTRAQWDEMARNTRQALGDQSREAGVDQRRGSLPGQ